MSFTKCRNTVLKGRHEVRAHLIRNGIVKSYKHWVYHGETIEENLEECNANSRDNLDEEENTDYDDLIGMVHDACAFINTDVERDDVNEGYEPQEPNPEAATFYRLLKDADKNLYPGCDKVSKLSFAVKLLHLKCSNNWSDTLMDKLLKVFKEVLPNGALVPNSFYEAKKLIQDLGLEHIKIDACLNDCVIYWGEHANAIVCPVCNLSRWKYQGRTRNIPHKILHYFPLKPRLQRLYMSKITAKDMRWHEEKRINDGILRHPADSFTWKSFDDKYKSFSADPRSVRLGLASDGFQPFGNMSTPHSIWPVVLIPYNLPPWQCMKDPYFMMTLLIPGPKCPENDIDVYLQPLIEELKELWDIGVETYDAHTRQNFNLHAAVLWTINDFLVYGNLSGWMSKGKLACPCCHKDTCSLSIRSKICYMGHHRFLPKNHSWRRNKRSFDGKCEYRDAPKVLTGDDVLDQLRKLKKITFGKGQKRKHDDFNDVYNWRKKSIFFQLLYWKDLKLCNNLDVMHIVRNISSNILGIMLDIKGKTKDTLKGRFDLVDMNIRHNLHPYIENGKLKMPVASYTLSPQEKIAFCNFLSNLRVPDGFSSNISRCVNINEKKISGLKCHDHHILLQQILPVAIRGLLPKFVCEPLIELSNFFRNLCSKSLKVQDLKQLEEDIVMTLCKLETIFPPAFFDIMIHLPIHLASEAKIGGPVQYRWMYPVERYLNSVETKFNRVPRNDDGATSYQGLSIFAKDGCAKGAFKSYELNAHEFTQAQAYVLRNCEEVWPYIEEHKKELEEVSSRNVLARHHKEFPVWFYERVSKLKARGKASEDLLSLAVGPFKIVHRYGTYIVNRFRFHARDRVIRRKSQNSGVLVKADDTSADKEYYGVLEDIFELLYVGNKKVVLFKCHWWDVGRLGRGYRIDNYGYISINIHGSLNTNEPFVLASQAQQVFYVEDLVDSNWLVVVKTYPRDAYDVPSVDNDADDDDDDDSLIEDDVYQQEEQEQNFQYGQVMNNDELIGVLHRDDLQPQSFSPNNDTNRENLTLDDFINDDEIEKEAESETDDDQNNHDEYSSDEYSPDD
ncbi:uncharacterized protein [Elaeis guineensis]|uniref:uncharacterized protein n=1 Tax=Elaeis guineensis var. tenera TaxID=51953 RepID=UPI003C6DA9BC